MIANHSTAAAVASQKTAALGELPEWNLADLYAGMDAPELKHDLDKAMSDSIAFEDRWKGKLASEAGKGANTTLGECLKQYEALEERAAIIQFCSGREVSRTDAWRMACEQASQQAAKVIKAQQELASAQ